MDFTGFFEWIPNVAIIGLGVVVLVAVWMVWRSIAPAAPGISLGYYEVLGRYAGSKLVKRIKGTLVDATALFLNPEIEPTFKRLLSEDLLELSKRVEEQEAKNLKELADSLSKHILQACCRIIITRERLFTKHVIIQYGNADKPLHDFAAHEPSNKFTLGFGFLSQGIITGQISTLPQPWNIYKLGKLQVHIFKPDLPASEPEKLPGADVTKCLAKLALYAPATVELKELLRSKDEQLKEKDRKLQEMGRDMSEAANERDVLRKAVQGFSTTGEVPESFAGKRFDLMDFVTLGLPTLLGYLIAEAFGLPPLAGVFLGMFIGAYFVFGRH